MRLYYNLEIIGKEDCFMLMTIQTLLTDYLAEIQKIYGLHLKSVILYGSYARGDYTPESDVDIMILVDLPDDEIDQYADELAEVGFEYNVAHDIWMIWRSVFIQQSQGCIGCNLGKYAKILWKCHA